MTAIVNFLRHLIAHPKTSAMGFAAIAGTVGAVIHDVKILTHPDTYIAVFMGLGLLFAADGKP